MPHEPLQIEKQYSETGDCSVLRLTGPILVNNLFEFQWALIGDSNRVLLLDLNGVPYIDSAGIGCLVTANVNRKKDGRVLGLIGATDRVRNTLHMANVEPFFQFFDSVVDAQKVFPGTAA